MRGRIFTKEEIESIIADYQNGDSPDTLSNKYGAGKLKIKEVITNAGIQLRTYAESKNFKRNLKHYVVEDARTVKYLPVEGKHYVCKCKLDGYTKPLFKYYIPKFDRYKRWHKRTIRNIMKKNGWSSAEKSEHDKAKELGYDRIWDCGLIRYVWKRGD